MTEPSTDAARRKAEVAAVFDRGSATYDQLGVGFFRDVGRLLVARAAPRPGERVLDVGCGRGASALPAARAVGGTGHVLGVDLAPGMVRGLLDEAAAAGLSNVEGRVGDAEDPDQEDGSWDLVQASLVLFFLPDLTAALRRHLALLRPGGRLAASWFGERDTRWDPVYEALTVDLEEERRHPSAVGPFASVAAFEQALTDVGFTEVTTDSEVVETRYPDPATWWEIQWSHGGRGTLERLRSDGLLDAARDRVFDELRRIAEPDGAVVWRGELRFTVGRRAPS